MNRYPRLGVLSYAGGCSYFRMGLSLVVVTIPVSSIHDSYCDLIIKK